MPERQADRWLARPRAPRKSGTRDRARSGESTRCGLIGHTSPHVGDVAVVRENKEFSGHYDCTRMLATPASKAPCPSQSLRGAVGHAGITPLGPSPFRSPSRSGEDARCREVNTRPLNCLSSRPSTLRPIARRSASFLGNPNRRGADPPKNDQDFGLRDCGPMACGIRYENDALPETLDSLLTQACLLKKEK